MSLEEQTKIYQRIRQVWEGQSKEVITTGEAIEALTTILENINPARPLARAARTLQWAIILGNGKEIEDVEVEAVH